MKITLLTYGSEGDVAPFAALSKALVSAGHQVCLAAPGKYKFLVQKDPVEFRAFPGDPQQMVRDLVNQAGNNWWRMVRSMSRFVLPLGAEVSQIARAVCQGSDLILHSFLLTNTGYEIAREMDIPDISVQTFPVFSSTGAFPSPAAPDLPFGSFYRRWTHHLVTQVFWHGSRLIYGSMRKKNTNLPPLSRWPFNKDNNWQTPILYAFSPSVIPRPEDWRDDVYIPGYWFDDDPGDWIPESELLDFIHSGTPPIAIVFGSTVKDKTNKLDQIIQKGLEITKQRAVIVGDNPGVQDSSDIYYQRGYIPYSWLFEHAGAVIHHGGAGTTGKALKAGIPGIILPFTSDQPFWGRIVYKLGAGPKPISPKIITPEKLAQAIHSVVENQDIRFQSAKLGREISAEDGIKQAVKIIEELVAQYER